MKRTNIDERKAIRRSCKIPTDFSVKNRASMGVITNISPFGAFIKSLDIFKIGEIVRMVIKHKANVKRTGIIKWTSQIGSGLQFAKEQPLAQEDAKTYNSRGNACFKKGQIDQAISDYNKAIEINPRVAVVYKNRGNAYRSKGQIDMAISDFNKAIEIDPMFADAYHDRGLTYGKKGEYDKAISDFSKAIEINPKLSWAYNNLGIAYYFKGQIDQAISDFSKAIEINPRFALAYANRGEAYFSKKEYDKAWNDVSEVQVLGYKIDPRFLETLREVRLRKMF